jgi:hypothetical protein
MAHHMGVAQPGQHNGFTTTVEVEQPRVSIVPDVEDSPDTH